MDLQLQESRLFLYGDLQPITLFEDKEGYTSDKLKSHLVTIFENSKYKKIAPFITELIKRDIIIPCVVHSNIIGTIIDKIMFKVMDFLKIAEDYETRKVVAYFTNDENKVYVIITNQTDMTAWIDDKDTAYSIMHEMMHYIAFNKPDQFYSVWKDFFVLFYAKFFESLLTGVKLDYDKYKKVIYPYINNVHVPLLFQMDSNKENQVKVINLILHSYIPGRSSLFNRMTPLFSTTKERKFIARVLNVMGYIVYQAFMDSNRLHTEYTTEPLLNYNINTMWRTYKQMGVSSDASNSSLTYQEFFLPSEIAAISIGSKNAYEMLIKTLVLMR